MVIMQEVREHAKKAFIGLFYSPSPFLLFFKKKRIVTLAVKIIDMYSSFFFYIKEYSKFFFSIAKKAIQLRLVTH